LVTFEPIFPSYLDHVEMAGGIVNGVALEYKDGTWRFDPEALRAALARPKTKVFILNTPHNPTGKVFTRDELKQVSDILDDFPHILCITDEVYEMLTFDDHEHFHFASIGDNWERTVSIFSGGKLLNATGWRIGWVIGPQKLLHLGGVIINAVYYCFNTPGQVAIGHALDKVEEPGYNSKGQNYRQDLRETFMTTRDFMVKELESS